MTSLIRIRWLLACGIIILVGGTAAGYGYHRNKQASDRMKVASCLRQVALAGLLDANAPATQPSTRPTAEDERVWDLLRGGGQVVLMRHARTTPGTGDPPNFKLGDCSTQRNLSDAGREQARRIGAEFRRREVPVGRVLSSQYCRCLDTARLAFGKAEEEPALNSTFEDRGKRDEQTRAAKALIAGAGGKENKENLVLVTHQVNITEVAGVAPEMGEMVILTPADGGFKQAGRLKVGELGE